MRCHRLCACIATAYPRSLADRHERHLADWVKIKARRRSRCFISKSAHGGVLHLRTTAYGTNATYGPHQLIAEAEDRLEMLETRRKQQKR
jgi:hypothetical protein